jgi:hypothetical protein
MASLFTVSCAHAQMTGNKLQESCKEEAKDEDKVQSWFNAGICAGYINGVTEAQIVE